MRGLPLTVVIDHQPPSRPPIRLHAGQHVRAGRYDRDPQGWPAFRVCTTTDGDEGWVPDRFLDAGPGRAVDEEQDATVLADYDTTELAVRAGDVVRSLDEDGLWVWCREAAGLTGWVPLAALSVDGAEPLVPRGPVPIDAIPPQLFLGEWVDGAPLVGRPEPDGTGHRGFPLRDTPGLTLSDYRRTPVGKRRHELHRGVFVFPGHEPLVVNALRTRLGADLHRWAQEHGGRAALSGPAAVLSEDTVVWPWLAVTGPGRADRDERSLVARPELAVEVAHPDVDDPYREDRLALLAEHGTPEVWLLDPASGAVEVRTAAGEERVDGDGPLRSAVLPGLVLDPVDRRLP